MQLLQSVDEKNNIESIKEKKIIVQVSEGQPALDVLMTTPRMTHLGVYEGIMYHQTYKCEIAVAWKSKYPNTLSYIFPKTSPYFPFFNYWILKYMETGLLRNIQNKYVQDQSDCSDERRPESKFQEVV